MKITKIGKVGAKIEPQKNLRQEFEDLPKRIWNEIGTFKDNSIEYKHLKEGLKDFHDPIAEKYGKEVAGEATVTLAQSMVFQAWKVLYPYIDKRIADLEDKVKPLSDVQRRNSELERELEKKDDEYLQLAADLGGIDMQKMLNKIDKLKADLSEKEELLKMGKLSIEGLDEQLRRERVTSAKRKSENEKLLKEIKQLKNGN